MALSKSRIFLLVCLAGIMGLGFGYKSSDVWLMVAGMILIMTVSLGWRYKVIWAVGLISTAFILSSFWSKAKTPPDLSQYFNQKLEMIVVIDDDPAIKEKSINFPAKLIEINGEKISSRIIVVLPRYPVYEYGSRLVMEGKLEASTEYNFKDNVSGQIVFPKISESLPGQGSKWKLWLYNLKHNLLEKIGSILPEPHSGLLAGLLLGTRNMPEVLLEQFRVTGTSHIVAVSGFNVTIVAGFLDALLRRFGRSVSFYSSLIAIFGFVIITGASASVVRAGIMGCMILLAQHAGRMYASVNALVFAALVMLIDNPKLLQFDIGFQLSFAALVGLLFVHPKIEEWVPYKNFFTDAIYPTIAAQITTAPLILYHFGNVSLISVFTNFLVLASIPWAMLFGFIMLITGYLLPFLGTIFGGVTWLILEYIIKAVEWTAGIPGAAVSELTFPLWALIIYFLILLLILKWKPKPKIS